MQQYESVYKNVGTTPRTSDEAFKTADYATPIWRCETENENGLKFFINMLVGMLMVGLPLVMIYSFVLWLDTIK
jgi:hypothetical protein